MDNESEDAQLDSLYKEFAPPVEQSIVLLLFQEQGYEKAREALAELAKHARDEEASGFDALAGQGFSSSEQGSGEDAVFSPLSRPEGATSMDSWTTASTATNEDDARIAQSLEAEGGGPGMDRPGNDGRPPEDVLARLQEAFPAVKERDIHRALREAGGDPYSVTGLLLNIHHLEETGQRPKGIDAFAQADDHHPGQTTAHSKARRRAARKVAAKQAAAHQDDQSSGSRPRLQPLRVDYQLAPLALDEDGEEGSSKSAKKGTAATPTAAASASATGTSGHSELQENAQRHWEAAGAAFTSASAAWRRGQSDPLFRQAAVVYADRGHTRAALARVTQSAAADVQVDAQSDESTVDVHHVGVADGVRIALERTQQWWGRLERYNNSGSTSRARFARENPLAVITGSGVHSAKGVSRMYKEVGEALRTDGWIVEPGRGHYHVKGRKRV